MKTSHAIGMFLDSRRSQLVSPTTIRAYTWALEKMENKFPELPESPSDIQRLFIDNSGLSPASHLSLWRRLRTFWMWAEEEGIAPNIMSRIPAPRVREKLPRTLTSHEVRRLLASTDNERDYAILAVLLDTGMRLGELESMTRGSLGPDYLRITGKTGDRRVPVLPSVMELVEKQGDDRGIWIGSRGRLTAWGLQLIVRRCMKTAGFKPPKIGPHMLRHTFGLNYILKGGDPFSLKRIMGHQDIATTMIYVNMSTELVAQQHRKFSPMADIVAAD
ncbi:MAG: tyrosine-type recombinase/integrase [Chloroflexi bacterium]|nr:tyrosine-type recombinase/integrase [Chloroflexota bacterium]